MVTKTQLKQELIERGFMGKIAENLDLLNINKKDIITDSLARKPRPC